MAKTEVKTGEEKLFTIPLRRDVLKKTRYKKAKKSVDTIKGFIQRHMKTSNFRISPSLNERLWAGGASSPPSKIKIKAATDDKGKVTLMLPDERLEITEKRGLKEKIFKRKGETETAIVKSTPETPKGVPEVVKEPSNLEPTELTEEEQELIADVEKEVASAEKQKKTATSKKK